jgi:sugar/nucleoside kinase (ribokinase family)
LVMPRAASERRTEETGKEAMDTLLGSVDTAVCSADFHVPEYAGSSQVIDFLKSRGVREIAITAGSKPITRVTERHSGEVPVPQIPVVDTMGAGDILHGAYCWYATQGLAFPEDLRRAAAIASEPCRYSGTRAWMPRATS